MAKLTNGSKARLLDGCSIPAPAGDVAAHPVNPDKFLVVINDGWGDYVLIVDENGFGTDCGNKTTRYVEPIDPARVAWDALDGSVREVIYFTGQTKKITAIKALRSITGLGLVEAKRAVEEFRP